MLKSATWLKTILICINFTAYADSWQSYTIILNQHKLHYYQSGSGKPVVLLTGYATTSNFWNKTFVNCLARKNTVYLLDYRGINTDESGAGNTSIPDMALDSISFMQALHLSHASVVGWSMGGGVAQQMSFMSSVSLGRVVLIAPLEIDNLPLASGGGKKVDLKNYADVLNYVFDANLYNYNPNKLNYYKNDLFLPQAILFPNEQIGAKQLLAMNDWIRSLDTRAGIKNSEYEYLFLLPNQDTILDPAKTEFDAREYQHAKIIKFENSGHDLSMQSPGLACAQIQEFINQ